MIKELQIQNLKCGGCANTIEDELSHLSGVSHVHVDHDNSSVKFQVEHVEDEVWVADKLIKLGYPPVGENNNAIRQIKSYVSCMKGRVS